MSLRHKVRDYSMEVMEESRLVVHKEESRRHYDRFRGRLIFPISDEQGRVIGFSDRLLADDVKAAKYVNSPETPIFTKGKDFFGLDKSKRAILDSEKAIVCEGQVDLISCYVAGIQNVVAPQGTALTADQARILKRYAGEVVLCFDGELERSVSGRWSGRCIQQSQGKITTSGYPKTSETGMSLETFYIS